MGFFERQKWTRRRECTLPTWRGWLLVGVAGGAVALGLLHSLHPFLAVTERVEADVLVVEGWVPDFALRAGVEEFNAGKYRRLLVPGGPMEKGEPLSEYRTLAEFGRATLERLGCPTNELRAVPAAKVRQDRTYASAVALRRWLIREGSLPSRLNVLTADAHARRTRLLFEKAFGDEVDVGIIAVPDDRFESARWWRSSMGFRTVIGEAIAYFYSRFLYAPTEEVSGP